MATNDPLAKPDALTTKPSTLALKTEAVSGIARVRRMGLDPEKLGEAEAEQLRRVGIDSETYERKAVTYNGLIREFGRPLGPQIYNAIAVAAFGGVPSNKGDLSIMTLQDEYISPRGRDESEEDFSKRLEKHRARRAKVEQLLADAEGGNG